MLDNRASLGLSVMYILQGLSKKGEISMTVEGTLDVIWENYGEPLATPRYKLLFMRYQGFKNGGQPHKLIVGNKELESYLAALGLKPQRISQISEEVLKNKVASITNLMMEELYIKEYEK